MCLETTQWTRTEWGYAMKCTTIRFSLSVFFLAPLLLTACGGGGGGGGVGGGGSLSPTYTIGGTISGHADTVVLQNSGGDNRTLSVADGSFVFATALVNGATYNVTALIQPVGQTCAVTNGSGAVNGANITNVVVSCTANPTYTIGGTIAGLTGTVELQNNGGDDLARSINGGFAFTTALATGSAYNVTVFTQPAGQTCSVTSGSGTVSGANVSGVQVNCVTNPGLTYTVGGTISGLTGTVVLRNNGGDSLTRTTNGGFTFATAIADGAAYNVTVFTQPAGQTCSVTSGSGNVSAASVTNVAVGCVTNGKSWRTAGLVENDNTGNAFFPQVAVDAGGNALAVWSQSDGVRDNIWASRYAAGAGWGAPELIETRNTGSALYPQVAFDAGGNALAVWSQSDGTRYNIWANRYTAGFGWGAAVLIENDNLGSANFPQVAFDAAGNAFAVWEQSDTSRRNIWVNRYTAGAGWGTATKIENYDDGEAIAPQIAFDAAGNALAVWQHSDGTRYSIRAARYTAGVGWGTADLIESDDWAQATSPQIAFDAAGNALAVWQQQTQASRYDIWANRYTAGAGWETAALIETADDGQALSPHIAVDTSGNAIAVWHQSDGARMNIRANRYTAGAGWGMAELIETGDLGDAGVARVGFDAAGNAHVVWHQSDGVRTSIWAQAYIAGSGWDTAGLIETDNAGNASYPQIAVAPNGNAIAVWHQSDGSIYSIGANRYE